MTTSVAEELELKRIRPQIEGEGFVLIDEPSIRLPEGLRNYRPDFLAKRGDQYLAIEIKQRRSPASTSAINRLERIFSNIPNWTLFVHFIEGESEDSGLRSQDSTTIRSGFQEVRNAVSSGNYRSAFLLSWASFEAVSRTLHNRIFSKPQSPGRVITVLAERGYIDPASAELLRHAAKKRNALIHGELDAEVGLNDVELMLDNATRLLELSEDKSRISKNG